MASVRAGLQYAKTFPDLLQCEWEQQETGPKVEFGVVAIPRHSIWNRLVFTKPQVSVFDFERAHRHDVERGKPNSTLVSQTHLPLGNSEVNIMSGYIGERGRYLQFDPRCMGAALVYAKRLDDEHQVTPLDFNVSRPNRDHSRTTHTTYFEGPGVLVVAQCEGTEHRLMRPARQFHTLGVAVSAFGYNSANVNSQVR